MAKADHATQSQQCTLRTDPLDARKVVEQARLRVWHWLRLGHGPGVRVAFIRFESGVICALALEQRSQLGGSEFPGGVALVE